MESSLCLSAFLSRPWHGLCDLRHRGARTQKYTIYPKFVWMCTAAPGDRIIFEAPNFVLGCDRKFLSRPGLGLCDYCITGGAQTKTRFHARGSGGHSCSTQYATNRV